MLSEPIEITKHSWPIEELPVVSVFNWVYNQADFIRKSIDTILDQKTTFKVEIIIHDDASNDGTTEIIKEYEELYPTLFNNIIQKENQWSQGKSVMDPLIKKPRGRFIALSHGDDYWTDTNKLQRQVEFLQRNEDFVLCFHKVNILRNDGSFEVDSITHVPPDYQTINDLASYGNYIHSVSVVFRNVISDFPPEIEEVSNADYFLYMILTQYGKLHCINKEMAVYRYGVGVWSARDKRWKALMGIHCFVQLFQYYKGRNNSLSEILLRRVVGELNKLEGALSLEEFEAMFPLSELRYLFFNKMMEEHKILWSRYKKFSIENMSLLSAMKLVIKRIVLKPSIRLAMLLKKF